MVFWGLVRTPPEKRDLTAIETSKAKTTAAIKILDAQLAKTAYVAGDAFSMADITVFAGLGFADFAGIAIQKQTCAFNAHAMSLHLPGHHRMRAPV